MNTVITKLSKENTKVTKHHFSTAIHVARNKLPFRHYQLLCGLQKNGVHMGGSYGNNKACKVFIDHINEAERDRIRGKVKKTKWISVLADGSTDHSITEQENVYVRYVDDDGVQKTELADIVPVESADATDVFDAIEKGLHNISMTLEKRVCTNMDGASVNQGKCTICLQRCVERTGVAKKIADAVPHSIVNIWCVVHNVELAMLDAIKMSSNVVAAKEECVDFVYDFYYHSSK